MNLTKNSLKRTNMCAEVSEADSGKTVTVMGWVNKKRELSNLTFITLRDRTGLVQIVVDASKTDKETAKLAASVRSEFVIAVKGKVAARTPENINPEMKTGRVEIEALEFVVLSEAEVPPFQVTDTGVKEDLRLKYRYIDLRRPELQNALITRHNIARVIREFLNSEGFLDIETPYLTKSTPEGARDYLVPSRVNKGSFYALPQSPQLLKQILMISGFDKYYQITRCFRDEDLRADRQPEFTQVDMELSFVDANDVMDVNERLIQRVMKEILNKEITIPFKRMPYTEAMERFGSDKPDLRFGMEIVNISDLDAVKASEFPVFANALAEGGSVRGINAKGCANFTRKQIDSLADTAKLFKAKGLVWVALLEDGSFKSSAAKFFTDISFKEMAEAFDAQPGDLILICADKDSTVLNALGNIRLEVASRLGLTDKSDFNFLWVVDFPLLEYDAEENRYYAKHHPFTAPLDEDLHLFDTDPSKMRAKAYDMVLNGTELGGGSIRIYRRDIQEKMFGVLGFTREEAYSQFSYLLEAFKYGAPPHGGLAFGLDRICMLLTGRDAIRDVIAFPKVKDASCPLTGAPDKVSAAQLGELGIELETENAAG
jgi:aspartyl-tRNA synthetase